MRTSRQEGHEVFFELGVVTDSELHRLTGLEGYTGKNVNLAECELTLEQSASSATVYFISLRGLPLDEILAMRRLRLSSSLMTVFQEQHLNKGNMLSADHGQIQFRFQAGQKHANSPDVWKPCPKSAPLTIEQVTQKAQKFLQASFAQNWSHARALECILVPSTVVSVVL